MILVFQTLPPLQNSNGYNLSYLKYMGVGENLQYSIKIAHGYCGSLIGS